ncbi:2OG-Fe(II) oxygenase [Aestuariivirga sp.]|uniref:HalD/BesD family halogenase n=1 Tax=Aestuariivirga sp. TaxID=2650926 RepID=UPI0035940E2B
MRNLLDLDRYPLDRPGTAAWHALVDKCRADLARDGMYNLEGLVRPEALDKAIAELRPVFDTLSFTHRRSHNIYFRKDIPGLEPDHPALQLCETVNHTVCADQIMQSVPLWIYEWSPFITFLAATMDNVALYPMRDALARANVMAYREGEALNWHFDRSEFTTTLLLQAPEQGGDFVYRSDLRTDDDPNYDGVAKLLRGEDTQVKTLKLAAGTLNVFRGKNTAHKVSTVRGQKERIIAVFSYFDRPGVTFSKEDQIGFYGRTA